MKNVKTPARRIMADMSATLLHHGHIRLLKQASELGEVIVGLTTDEEVKLHKGYWPEIDWEARKEILMAIRYVTDVVPSPWMLDDAYLDQHKIDLLVHGGENFNQVREDRLVIFPYTSGISSRALREKASAILETTK